MKTGRDSKLTAAYECPFPGCKVRISDFENLPAHIAEQHPFQFHHKRQVNLSFTSTQSLRLPLHSQQEQHKPCITMSPLGTCPECYEHFCRETPTEMVKAVGKHRRMYHHPKAKSSANFKRRYLRKNRRQWEIEQRILPYMAQNQEQSHSYASDSNQGGVIYDLPFGGHIAGHVQLQVPDLQSSQAQNYFLTTQTRPIYSPHRTHGCGVTWGSNTGGGHLLQEGIQPQHHAAADQTQIHQREREVMMMWSGFLQRNGLLKRALQITTLH